MGVSVDVPMRAQLGYAWASSGLTRCWSHASATMMPCSSADTNTIFSAIGCAVNIQKRSIATGAECPLQQLADLEALCLCLEACHPCQTCMNDLHWPQVIQS